VIVVDPKLAEITMHDASGTRVLKDGNQLRHAALPGFTLDVAAFSRAARR
jgi:hypothetical protein